MNTILVNGNPIQIPFKTTVTFDEVMSYIKGQIDPNSALIASIRLDGTDVIDPEDQALAATPSSHFNQIEIFTLHPKDVAQETLSDLIEFSKILENLSIKAATRHQEQDFPVYFSQLIDGLNTFTEAVSGVKRILKLGLFNSIQSLESSLLVTLKKILATQEGAIDENLDQLLTEELPKNLKEWRETGLPSLIRSRDS